MNPSTPRDVIHSLGLVKQVLSNAAHKLTGKCGNDCKNCPCSKGDATPSKHTHPQESSEHRDEA